MKIRKTSCDDTTFLRLWQVVARVPRGRVATYGQIARMAGLQRGARTVGWALRAIPDGARVLGRRVPWHRIINAEGVISPRGEALGAEVRRQAAALRREGIAVSRSGRVDLGRYLWRGERRRP
jgi:methylated-DNA-protein-cysteine methyltransferase-like protein